MAEKSVSTRGLWRFLNNLKDLFVQDAPSDGKQYARKNKTWAEVQGGGGPVDAYTKTESDSRFAHKTGDEDIEGYKRFKGGIAVADALLLNVPNDGQGGGDVPYVYGDKYDGDGSAAPVVTFGGTMGDEPCIVRGVETPQGSKDAANKEYVDGQIDVVKAFKGNPYKDLGYKADHVAALTAMLETEGLYFRTYDDDFDYYYVVTLKQSEDGFITGFFVCSEESYVVYTFYWTRGEEEVHVSGLVPTPADNLTTSSPSIPLSANQGRVLNGKLGQLEERTDQLEGEIGEVGGFSKKMIREQFLALSTYFANDGTPTYYGAYDAETDTFKYGKRRTSNEYKFEGLTYEEVAIMIAQSVKMSEFSGNSAPCQSVSGVTPLIVTGWWNVNWQGGFNGQYAFAQCQTKYIFIPFPAGLISSLNATFNRCVNLEAVYTSESGDSLAVTNISSNSAPFSYCNKLKYVHLSGLKANISLADSPLLQSESVEWMISHAQTAAITITLHADAYARAMADADVQTALASKTNVTLASA